MDPHTSRRSARAAIREAFAVGAKTDAEAIAAAKDKCCPEAVAMVDAIFESEFKLKGPC